MLNPKQYDTPCPNCKKSFPNPGARASHIRACIEDGVAEDDISTGTSIEEAIETADQLLHDATEQSESVALVWTGDHASTALLRRALETIPSAREQVDVIFPDHGQHFPETYAYVEQKAEEWDVEYEVAKNGPMIQAVSSDPPYTDGEPTDEWPQGEPTDWVPAYTLRRPARGVVERLIDGGDVPEHEYREQSDGTLMVPFLMGTVLGTELLFNHPIRRVQESYDAILMPERKWEAPEDERQNKDSVFWARYASLEDTSCVTVRPMLDWREAFCFAFLGRPERRVEVNPLYEEGYRNIFSIPQAEVVDGEQPALEGGRSGGNAAMEALRDLGYI